MRPIYTLSLLAVIGGFNIIPASAQSFTQKSGAVLGNQYVVPVPIGPGSGDQAQALVYYPDDYFLPANSRKRYPLYVFLHGKGEGSSNDIKEVLNTSLPQMISQGLRPYGIDPVTKDTVKYIVVSPHCASCNGGYLYPQLQYTIPYLMSTYRVDTSCVWVGGLSAGGSASWSVVMGAKVGDTSLGKRITGIMPMANGGYDDNIRTLAANLDTIAKRGLACLYIIGDQDPGYNQIGFFQYQALMKKYSQPGRYYDHVVPGGTHSTNVWNPPFPLDARVWSSSMNSWTQMWTLRKSASVTTPPVTPPDTTPSKPPVVGNPDSPSPPSSGKGGVYVTKAACTEYRAAYLYSDGVARSFTFNGASGYVELMPLLINGRKAVDISTGFNLITILDDQGYVWVTDPGKNTCTRWDKDATGQAANGFTSIYGYFSTYLGIRSDGSIWYWGGDDYKFGNGKTVDAPTKVNQPAGVKFVKISAGSSLLGLSSTGDVYLWGKGSNKPTKVNLPGAASDIAASHTDFCIVSVGGWPYAWGSESRYWGGDGSSYKSDAPVSVKDLWKMPAPIKRITANYNTIHYIDTNGDLYGLGDNPNGEVGNGDELVNHAEKYPTPYAWSWMKYEYLTGAPAIHISPGTKFKQIFTGNTYTFYHYAVDQNDSLYFWGRNKSFVGGDGAYNNQESQYPNALDVLKPTRRTPMGVAPTQTATYDFTKYTLKADARQTISSLTTTLNATATPSTLVSKGRANYGYKIVKYQWTQQSGPSCTIVSPQAATTQIKGLTKGIYIFSIQTTDDNTATITARDTVEVKDGAPAGPPDTATKPPVTPPSDPPGMVFQVSAGPDVNVMYPVVAVQLQGSAKVEKETPSYCQWTELSGPNKVWMWNDRTLVPLLANLTPGKYSMQVVMVSTSGRVARDTMVLSVTSWFGESRADTTMARAATMSMGDSSAVNDGGVGRMLRVFPNPVDAGQSINVEMINNTAGRYKFVVLDASGRVVKEFVRENLSTGNIQTLSLTGLIRGAYILCAHNLDNGFIKIQQFIIR